MTTDTTFRHGDELIVAPADGDDPDALEREGQTCTFVRRLDAMGGTSIYARVRFPGEPKERLLRIQDLARKEAVHETQ